MQDNAPGHGAITTIAELKARSITPIYWPPRSLDLNPIETIWNWMKDYIDKHYPEIHGSYSKLRQIVNEAWKAIPDEKVKDLIKDMKKRCQAVIDADGGHTKY
jgi:transposase